MKILVYSDSPTAPTGFGSVTRNIFGSLMQLGHLAPDDVAFFGINYIGEPHSMPFKVWPACVGNSIDRDPYGKSRFAEMTLGNFAPFDVIWFLLDHFSLSQGIMLDGKLQAFVPAVVTALRAQYPQGRPKFRTVVYTPVDSDSLRPEWITWQPGIVDHPVAYTQFGMRTCCEVCPPLTDSMTVIPHGTNPELFFPLTQAARDDFRKRIFGIGPEVPLIVNVNRNQPRKDIPRTLQVFRRVLDALPNARLYLHMNSRDSAGFDLERLAHALRIPAGHVIFPANFSEGIGIPVEQLNMIYNAADVMLTTARGEGWSLSTSEAMTAGACVVAPDNTALSELLADGRGILVPPLPDRQTMISDNDQLRPVADVPRTAHAVLWALKNREEARAIGRKGMAWARKLSWRETVAPMWWKIFAPGAAPVVQAPSRFQFKPRGDEKTAPA